MPPFVKRMKMMKTMTVKELLAAIYTPLFQDDVQIVISRTPGMITVPVRRYDGHYSYVDVTVGLVIAVANGELTVCFDRITPTIVRVNQTKVEILRIISKALERKNQ